MNLKLLARKIRKETQAYCILRKNTLDFTYKSTRNNTICITNPKIRQLLKAEDIIISNDYNIIEKQANKDPNGIISHYYIIQGA